MSAVTTAISKVADRLLGIMNGRMAATPEPLPPQVPSRPNDRGVSGMEFGILDAYYAVMQRPGERLAEMRQYDYLENEAPDVSKALDAYATMACTGTLTGATEGSFTVELDEDAPEALRQWVKLFEDVMQAEAYGIIRGMAKYGSYPCEVLLGQIDGRIGVVDFQHLPPGTMFRDISGGAERYWVQKLEGSGSAARGLPRWRIPHFAIWTNVVSAENTLIYGRSMLQPVARLAMQLQACEDALVVGRLTRAALRHVFSIDVSDVSTDEKRIEQRIKMAERLFSRKRQRTNSGNDSYQRPDVPDGDYYMPKGKNLAYDVKSLEGDTNLSNIKDLEFILKRYFGALGVPPAYLGQSETGGRSNLTQVDIHFARSARYLQLFACGAFLHALAVHMIVGGYDPELYTPRIIPPSIGARDELVHAQVRMLQSQIVTNLVTAGMDITAAPKWVLQTLMNMGPELDGLDDAELSKLFRVVPDLLPQAPTDVRRPDRTRTANAALLAVSKGAGPYIESIRALLRLDVLPEQLPANNLQRQHPKHAELTAGILGE